MTLGGKSTPVYIVTDAEVVSGRFTIASGPAITVSSLDILARGVGGGPAMPVYIINTAEVNRRGLHGGLQATPVVDMAGVRPVSGLQQAVPVYVTYGSLGDGGATPPPGAAPTDLLETFMTGSDAVVVQGNQTQGKDEYWSGVIV